MDELKPCPFCHSEARLVSAVVWRYFRSKNPKRHRSRGVYWHIGCSDPNCILFLDANFKQARLIFRTRNKDLAVRRWNRRVGEADEC